MQPVLPWLAAHESVSLLQWSPWYAVVGHFRNEHQGLTDLDRSGLASFNRDHRRFVAAQLRTARHAWQRAGVRRFRQVVELKVGSEPSLFEERLGHTLGTSSAISPNKEQRSL